MALFTIFLILRFANSLKKSPQRRNYFIIYFVNSDVLNPWDKGSWSFNLSFRSTSF